MYDKFAKIILSAFLVISIISMIYHGKYQSVENGQLPVSPNGEISTPQESSPTPTQNIPTTTMEYHQRNPLPPPPQNDQELEAFIKDRQTVHEYLIVAVANNGHKDFVMNWVESMKRNVKNTEKFVVVCLDEILYKGLSELGIPSLPVTSLIREDKVLEYYHQKASAAEAKWQEKKYFKLTNMKIEVVYELLVRFNQKIVFTDIDLVWVNPKIVNYINHLVEFGRYDFVYTLDQWTNLDTIVCTGFYAVRPSEFSKQFLKSIKDDERTARTHDQEITQDKIRALSVQDKTRFGYLPLILFQNGQMHDFKISEQYSVTPWTIHANFRIGFIDKRQLLIDEGVWYL